MSLKDRVDIEFDRALYKKSYSQFFRAAWSQVESDTLLWRWYQNYICGRLQAHLERFLSGEKRQKHLIICVPPRTSKSKMVTVVFPAYVWTRDPRIKIMTASYSDKLSQLHSIDTKQLINSNWYQERWGPWVQLDNEKTNTNTTYSTTKGGSRVSTSVGGSATGFGGDILIGDDLLDPFSAYSGKERESTLRWMRAAFAGTRLNDKERGFFILMQQRTHDNDPVGWFLKNMPEEFEVVNIPAELKFGVSPKELSKFYDENGLMDNVRFGPEVLRQTKKVLTPADYNAQFGQKPEKAGGNMIVAEDFLYYDIDDIIDECDRANFRITINFAADTAYTKNQSNSATVVISGFVFNGVLYITNVLRVFEEITSMVSYSISGVKKQGTLERFCYNNGYSPGSTFVIEPKASGKDIISTLRAFTALNVISYELKTTDKVTSLRSVLALIKSKRIALPNEAPWLESFIEECEAFKDDMSHDKDDQVDTLVMMIKMYLIPALDLAAGRTIYSSSYNPDIDSSRGGVQIFNPETDGE